MAASIEEVKGVYRTKHPAQVMVLGVVASDGLKMPPYFFRSGEKIGAEVYYKVLRYTVLHWLKPNYPEGNYVWTQDGAPAHTSVRAQIFCQNNFSQFWDKSMWPPGSPDLNPLDFFVCGYLENKSNATPHPNVDSLKAAIAEEWTSMPSETVIKACASFRRRVEAVIEAKGGHIE